LFMFDRLGVIVGERQTEGGVGMHSRPDRIGLLGKEIPIAGYDYLNKWLQVLGPLLGVRIVPTVELLGQLQEPGPAVRPLERLRVWLIEIGRFRLQILLRQMFDQDGANLLTLW